MTEDKRTVIWITTQFPNGEKNRNGIYIYSTIKFLSEYFDIHVLNIYSRTPPFLNMLKDPKNAVKIYKEWSVRFPSSPKAPEGSENLKIEYLSYFRLPKGRLDYLEKNFVYRKVHDYVKKYVKKDNMPIIHSNWIFPESSLAHQLKKDLGCDYYISLRGGDIRELIPGTRKFTEAGKILLGAKKVGAVTKKLFEEADRKGIKLDEEKKYLLNNYFDISSFKMLDREVIRKELNVDNKSRVIFYAGTLRQLKNVGSLIKATARLKESVNNIMLIIAGSGLEEHNLRKSVETTGLKDNVRFLGNIDPEFMGKYYNCADIFCLPSFSEGLPSVCVESLMCGTPVVASAVNGIPEIVIDTENGYLFDPNSVDDIYRKLKLALERDWDRKKMRDSVSRFMPDEILKEHVSFYSE